MKNKIDLDWFYAAGTRAIRTTAQTAVGMFTVGVAMSAIDWKYVASVSLVSGIYSLLTSIATKLPEVSYEGVLQIDESNPKKDTYVLAMNTELESLKEKKFVQLKVEPVVTPPQE